jgi:hypothetical protein
MRDLKTLNTLIDRIRSDYQFDSSSEDYMGFLNLDPSQDWTTQEYDEVSYMVENEPELLDDILEMRGLELQSFGPTEAIFVLIEEPFANWNQGRTPNQVQYSEMVVNAILSLAAAAAIITVLYSFFNI